jgi:hypothetical protein
MSGCPICGKPARRCMRVTREEERAEIRALMAYRRAHRKVRLPALLRVPQVQLKH